MTYYLTIVIPAVKKESLLRVLEGISKQTLSKDLFEVLIVDDAAKQNLKDFVLRRQYNFNLRIFQNSKNKGAAYSRNRGVKEARGNLILFLGDDIIPDKNLFKIHFEKHEEYSQKNIAVLGFVTWSDKIKITPFMRWLENGGPQNAYPKIEGKKWVSHNFFYGANISLKKDFLLKNGLFNEKFRKYGWEDLELGFRLSKKGLKILYNKKAKGLHFHKISLKDFLERMEKAGENAVLFNKLHPELKIIAPYFVPHKKIAREAVFNPLVIFILKKIAEIYENKKILPRLNMRLTSIYFFRGVKKGLEIYG